MGHRQDDPVESFCAPAPIPPVRLMGALDRQFEFPIAVVGEAQDVEIPGMPASLQDLPSPLDDLLRGDNRAGADRPGARQAVPTSRGVAHPIRPLFAKLLVAVAVAQQEQQAAIAEQVIAARERVRPGRCLPTIRSRGHSPPRRVSSRARRHGGEPA